MPRTKRPSFIRVNDKKVKLKSFSKKPKYSKTGGLPPSALRKARAKRKASSLELALYQMLDELKVPFRKERPISRIHVDIFLEPRTVIEAAGCFWHGCHICYKDLNAMQKAAVLKDGRRYKFLRDRGYDVIVIRECEVNLAPERVKATLAAVWKQINAPRR